MPNDSVGAASDILEDTIFFAQLPDLLAAGGPVVIERAGRSYKFTTTASSLKVPQSVVPKFHAQFMASRKVISSMQQRRQRV
jgi:hypothetical protein